MSGTILSTEEMSKDIRPDIQQEIGEQASLVLSLNLATGRLDFILYSVGSLGKLVSWGDWSYCVENKEKH